jgi:hypothetical protein
MSGMESVSPMHLAVSLVAARNRDQSLNLIHEDECKLNPDPETNFPLHLFPSRREIFTFILRLRRLLALPALPTPSAYFSIALNTERIIRITCCIGLFIALGLD